MIVGDIFEFMVSVYDQGIPNRERIVLYANETVNTGQYGLMVGIRATGCAKQADTNELVKSNLTKG